jgi:hypothetical protein
MTEKMSNDYLKCIIENSTTYDYDDVYSMALELLKKRQQIPTLQYRISQEELQRIHAELEEKGEVTSLYTVGDFVDELLHTREEFTRLIPFAGFVSTELLALRADAETSQNHNAGVIDRIVAQLREAGYTGTLSDMVDQACDARQFAENMSL